MRTAGLQSIQEVLNDLVIKCKQAKDVHWLSHENKFMKSYKFVACVYLLNDILPHLSRLSCIFQKENVNLSLIQPCLKSTIDAIKKYVDDP